MAREDTASGQSRDELMAEVDRLRREVERLDQEKRDLEVMMDMAADHADNISEQLERERDDLGTMLEMTTEHADVVEDELQNRAEELEVQSRYIRRQMGVAQNIQASMLPKLSDDILTLNMVDLAADMHPAVEVGGDLYDFFKIDEHRLAILIGDVADKGIPASLFMAMSLSWLRATAGDGMAPHACLEHVNNILAKDNDSLTFVTVFYGILDLRTGTFEYSNAGHCLPYLLTPGSEDAVQRIKNTEGFLLGIHKGMSYGAGRIDLEPGQSLFLYSDGIPDALNVNGVMFSDTRLETLLRNSVALPANGLIRHVKEELDRFTVGAKQTDDITTMAVRYLG